MKDNQKDQKGQGNPKGQQTNTPGTTNTPKNATNTPKPETGKDKGVTAKPRNPQEEQFEEPETEKNEETRG